jgi:hypothetical protein
VSRAVLALGSNLGDRGELLRAAVAGLDGELVAVSGAYRTPPWGDPDQPDYLNAVAVVDDEHRDAAGWLAHAPTCARSSWCPGWNWNRTRRCPATAPSPTCCAPRRWRRTCPASN